MKVDSYKKNAKLYDTFIGPLTSGLRALGMKMFPPREGMAVLDVGCGTGIHLELYQKAGCNVYGIDQSPSMLQVARNRLGESANLYMGDASNMPYQDKEFDLIVMSTVLHEMRRAVRAAVINESKRTLKEDGRILLIDFHPGPIRPLKGWFYKSIITFIEFAGGREHFKNYRDFIANKGLPAIASAHGLSIDKKKIVSGGNIALFLLRTDQRL
ncbi:MAG: methyltransferase domain-containing protein [Candidatus Aminicenantes bacterium]|nr:MAG: methyltransferase domain-containing protein [Candidatus Aminicenantes bacterium]